MIDSLQGTLLAVVDAGAVLDVNGVRFALEIPDSTASALPAVGQRATLLTRLNFNMNEGTFALFGFATEAERDCFDILRSISGIGPRKGLAILGQVEIARFATALMTNDLAYLSKLKGVGKKTAERLVVELREKMVPYAAAGHKEQPTGMLATAPANVRDAIEAMMVLGCRTAVAERAVAMAVEELGSDAKTEQLVRAALKHR
jgi:Holliday junction DNA helicase RuvA